jgi:hypothetical protein
VAHGYLLQRDGEARYQVRRRRELERHVSKAGGGGVSVSRRRRRRKRRRTRRRREEHVPLHVNNTSSRARSNEQVTHMATIVVVSSPSEKSCESRYLGSTQLISHLHSRNHCIPSLPSLPMPSQPPIPTSTTPSLKHPQPRPFPPRARGSAAQRTCAAQKPHAAHADTQTDKQIRRA